MDISTLLFIDTETTGLMHGGDDLVLEVAYAIGDAEPTTFYPAPRDKWGKAFMIKRLSTLVEGTEQRVGDLNHAFERWGEDLQGYPVRDMADEDHHWEDLYALHNSPEYTTIGQNVAFDLWMLTDTNSFEFQFSTYKSIDLSSYMQGFLGTMWDGNKPPSFAKVVEILSEASYPDKEPITQLPDHTAANDVRSMQQVVREVSKMRF